MQGVLAFLPLSPSPSPCWGCLLAMGLEVLIWSPHRLWAQGQGALGEAGTHWGSAGARVTWVGSSHGYALSQLPAAFPD